MAKTHVSLTGDGYRTTIQTRDHIYYADEPEEAGGTDTAVTPAEMLMGALGSCIAMTLKMYAQRKKWDLQGVEVDLDYERFKGRDYEDYEGDERYIHEIRKSIVLQGDLDTEQKGRLMEIAAMCPVHRLINTPTFWVDQLIDADVLPEAD